MSTEDPSSREHADVLVVGGGVVGACTAWFLAERGARVRLVERGAIASGCSYGNAGWIFSSHGMPLPRPGVVRQALRWLVDRRSPPAEARPLYIRPRLDLGLLRWLWRFARACNEPQMRRAFRIGRELGVRSQGLYETLAAHPGLDFGYEQRGLLVACQGPEALAQAAEELRLLQELGGNGRVVDAEELRTLAPAVGSAAAGGVLYPDDAHIDPERFVTELVGAARRKGVRVETDTEVLGIEATRGRVTGAITSRGPVYCDHLVLAGGAWSPGLAAPLGLALPVQPAKGYSVTVRRPAGFGEIPILLADAYVGVTPLGERLRFAGTLELAGLDLSINTRRVRALLEGVRRQLPGIGWSEALETWGGLRPLTPDDLPIVGRPRRYANLVVATGHGMNGICQAPVTGELAAQLVMGETPSLDPAPLSPDRF